jgi:hypothetical protein
MSGLPESPGRRRFLGQVTLTVGGVAVSGVSLLEAAPATCLVHSAAYPDACGDWTVDDMCGAYPPYAFDTGASQPHTVPVPGAGADRYWIM